MPYSKTTWTDRSVEKPLTFTLQTNADGTTTLIPAEGTIVAPGTAITSALLNNMEDGIASAARKTENQDMGGFTYSNMKIALPQDSWVSGGAGLDLKNSDVINLNSLFMNDTSTGDAEGIQWVRTNTPAGSFNTADYDSFRILDGRVYLNGKCIAGDATTRILWTGGYYLTSTQHITPSKALQDCANGWCLVWSDYDADVTTNNNFDYVFTIIPKNGFVYNAWHQAIMAGYSTATTVTVNAKQYAYTNTEIWGADINNSTNAGNNNADVVLRWVVEI